MQIVSGRIVREIGSVKLYVDRLDIVVLDFSSFRTRTLLWCLWGLSYLDYYKDC